MITEHELNEAIAEMNGQRHPNADTCLKLASYYTIKNELFPKEKATIAPMSYSYDPPKETTIEYTSGTEFSEAVNGKDINDVLKVLDDIMTGLFIVNPPLYKRIMRDMTE